MGFKLLEDEQTAAPAAGPKEAPTKRAAFTLLDDPDPTGSFTENALSGTGAAMTRVARGVGQRVREAIKPQVLDKGGFRDVGNPIADAAALPTEADEARARELEAPLMRTGGGKIGNFAGNVAATLPAMFVPGQQSYAGAGAMGGLMGWLQPTVEGESPTVNAAIGQVAGGVGKYVGDKIVGGVGRVMDWMRSRGAQQEAQNATRDATLAAGREAGYAAPPAQANPGSAWNQLLEGFSGKVKTGQAFSIKNQEVTNRLARESVGLAGDAPITKEGLKAVRTEAGNAYEAIANAGRFTNDDVFAAQITKLSDAQRVLAKEIPELADDAVLKTAANLSRKEEFDGRTLVELTKSLREKATQAFKAGETDAGRFYRGASQEVEDLIERNLLAKDSTRFEMSKLTGQAYEGAKDLLKAFQDARILIAKTHTIEAALNESTGNVVGAKLAAQLAKGKPLSGGLETAARFAQAFPKAMQDVERSGAGLQTSLFDTGAMGLLAGFTGEPLMMAGVAARPAVRAILGSKPYQAVMTQPSYGPGASMRLLEEMATNEQLRRLTPAVAGSLAAQQAH